MGRHIRIAVLLMTVIGLVGCAKEKEEFTTDTNTIIIHEDGSFVGFISEEFDESLYSYDDLQELTKAEIAKYNEAVGEEAIVLTQSEYADGQVVMSMTYRSAMDYQAFNQEIFFYGTVQEAIGAGYDLTTLVLEDAADSDTVIDHTGLDGIADQMILITEDASNIRGYEKVMYLEQGDTLVNKYEVDTKEQETEDGGITLHCVVF